MQQKFAAKICNKNTQINNTRIQTSKTISTCLLLSGFLFFERKSKNEKKAKFETLLNCELLALRIGRKCFSKPE